MSRTMSCSMSVVRRGARPLLVVLTVLAALVASAVAYADGVDVSHWQGTVDWGKVRSDDVSFAFMKATEGTYYTDPSLARNWAGAEKVGIYRAAYHFARPSVGSAAAQARYFVSKAGKFADKGDLPPVLDLEQTGGLSPAALQSWVSTWLTTTEQLTGRTPILYFSPYFWIDHMANSTAFTRYPLWIAHYTSGSPLVPGGWKTWTFWQRTSSGHVNGISGLVDMNRFNGSTKQLATLAQADGGSGAPAGGGTTLPAGTPTALTVTPATTTPAIGDSVAFTGTLATAPGAAAVVRRPVTLWSQPTVGGQWTQVASGVTDSAGRFALTASVDGTAGYQTRFIGGPKYAASASPVVRVTAARRSVALDLKPGHQTVRRGAALMLYGHVTDAGRGLAGQTVSYYKRSLNGGHWILVGRCRSLAPTGWHSLTIHPKIARVWKAVTSGSDRYLPRTSATLTVRPR
jgi:GH25 family lysozyme M1 (1,4-beta-N-acetylmuramidase)